MKVLHEYFAFSSAASVSRVPARDSEGELLGRVRQVRVDHHRVRLQRLAALQPHARRAARSTQHLLHRPAQAEGGAQVLGALHHPPRQRAEAPLHVPHAEGQLQVGDDAEHRGARGGVQPQVLGGIGQRVGDAIVVEEAVQVPVERLPGLEAQRGEQPPRRVVAQAPGVGGDELLVGEGYFSRPSASQRAQRARLVRAELGTSRSMRAASFEVSRYVPSQKCTRVLGSTGTSFT